MRTRLKRHGLTRLYHAGLSSLTGLGEHGPSQHALSDTPPPTPGLRLQFPLHVATGSVPDSVSRHCLYSPHGYRRADNQARSCRLQHLFVRENCIRRCRGPLPGTSHSSSTTWTISPQPSAQLPVVSPPIWGKRHGELRCTSRSDPQFACAHAQHTHSTRPPPSAPPQLPCAHAPPEP